MDSQLAISLSGLFLAAIVLAVILRILLRPYREPASRVAWVLVVLALPLAGIVAYLVLGEVRIGRKHLLRARKVQAELSSDHRLARIADKAPPNIPDRYTHLFELGRSISGHIPCDGNQALLADDSNQAIDWICDDIDAASDHVHLMFYIWLEDNNGKRVVQALLRAAARGVSCRVLVDALGSRKFIRSASWREMQAAGVKLRVAMPIGILPLRFLRSRVDVRNHRKIVVIDNRITYCGSQNCADPEFRIKQAYAPWVDVMLRLEGPVALQNQYLFVNDWMCEGGKDILSLLDTDTPAEDDQGGAVQVIATGPTYRASAMPELFTALIYSARRELVISTPYYVPNPSIQDALCASGWRGVDTTLIVPARNDSRFVAAASRSFYAGLLEAGVKIQEYPAGLLHSKTLTVDGEICLIGSANMDQRSFDLNYENNMLIHSATVTAQIHARQRSYIDDSVQVKPEVLQSWSMARRLLNNICAIVSPVL